MSRKYQSGQKRAYQHVSKELKDALISLVDSSDNNIKEAAKKLNIKYENAKALYRTHKQTDQSQEDDKIEAQSLQELAQAASVVITIKRVKPVQLTEQESLVENIPMKQGSQMLLPRLGKLLRRQRNGKFQRTLFTFDSEAIDLAEMTAQAIQKQQNYT